MRKLSIFCLFTILALPSMAQVDSVKLAICKEIVDQINNMTLYRTHVNPTDGNFRKWSLSAVSNKDPETQLIMYVDEQSRVRKFASFDYTEEYSNVNICYYDTDGKLCYSIDRKTNNIDDKTPNIEIFINGYVYCYRDNIVVAQIRDLQKDYSHSSANNIDSFNSHTLTAGTINSFLMKFEWLELSSTEALLKHYGITEVGIPKNCQKICFAKFGQSGFPAVVNRNDVRLRQGPGTKYPVVEKLNAGDHVFVEEMSKKEYITSLGEYNWFKIGDGQYIFGAFLEPVEK